MTLAFAADQGQERWSAIASAKPTERRLILKAAVAPWRPNGDGSARYSTERASPARPGVLYSPILSGEPILVAKARALAASGSACHSVGAGIRPGGRRVIRVIRAIEAVVVKAAADKTAPSSARVIGADVRQAARAKATDAPATKTSNATTAKVTHVTSAEATHVTSAAKATHVATATTATATTAGLCTSGNKAAGKQCACQNHHHSSSHDILHWMGGRSATGIVRHWRVSAR
jgi:hypothetical protein